jgi:hypothetical protein
VPLDEPVVTFCDTEGAVVKEELTVWVDNKVVGGLLALVMGVVVDVWGDAVENVVEDAVEDVGAAGNPPPRGVVAVAD